MARIDVYEAMVAIGPDIYGQVCSFRPIPECTYPAAGEGIEGRDVQFLHCTLYEIEAPEGYALTSMPDGRQAVPDLDKSSSADVTLSASAVRDLAGHLPGWEVVRIVWDYWGRRHSNRLAPPLPTEGPDPAG